MFEKDAKEYMHKDGTEAEKLLNTIDLSLTKRQAFVLINVCKQCFKDGAEFGYNKANEWHYVKDGVYPTDDKKVLCILGDFENDNLEVGYYSQVEGDSKRWRFENYDLPDDSEEGWGVSAWKEIVMPKEIE